MKESQIEAKLRDGVRAMGGKAYKFDSPGNVGVPDRLVILPGGKVLFAELKIPGGRLSKPQLMQITELRRLNCDVYEVWGMEGVNDFLDTCRRMILGGCEVK